MPCLAITHLTESAPGFVLRQLFFQEEIDVDGQLRTWTDGYL